MVGVLSRRWFLWAAAVVLGTALSAAHTDAALAGPLPKPSSDYELEALQECESGELECVKDVLDAMRQHTRQLARDCDHDAVFAALYTIVTKYYYYTVKDDPGFFIDTAFVNHEDAVFAHYYFWPYVNWHNELREAVPPAWQVAFDAADGKKVTAAGNLLLGVNAHVVRDLPFVLARLGLGHKDDHDKVNQILRAAYEPAIQAINDHLADSVDEANVEGTTVDEDALFQIVASWREQAWHDAKALTRASTDVERATIAAEIEEKAYLQAVELRAQFAYAEDDKRQTRDDYCAEHAWPPNWLGDE